jgi:thymidylate synthase (FAD)
MNVPYGKDQFDTEKVKAVIANCVKRGHLSVLEHFTITLKCLTNIGTYKDYTRHRHCAFTIESTSFVNYGNVDYIPMIVATGIDHESLPAGSLDLIYALKDILNIYPPKVARDWLPQGTAATMIMSTNLREWRYIISLRGDPNDNPLTIDLRNKIWQCLQLNYPFFFPYHDDPDANEHMLIHNAFGDHGLAM